MVRASYFHEISRLVFRIYLSERFGINKSSLDSVLPPFAPKAALVGYLQAHPRMVSEAKMVKQNEISSALIRPNFLQKDLHSPKIREGGIFPHNDNSGGNPRNGLHNRR